MSFLTHNKMKILVAVVTILLLVQMARLIPWLHGLQEPDVDHSPTPNGSFPPVSVAVFYEALCPDSKNFIIRQLSPAHEKAARLLTLTFIPYGKATTRVGENGELMFSCQHGPTECLGNKVHACGVHYISNQSMQLEYVACMIADNYNPEEIGRKCAQKLGVDWNPISRCSVGEEGSELLQTNGQLTSALSPRVSFIPTVTLDNRLEDQRLILKNLLKEVCAHFSGTTVPEECQSTRPTE